MTWLADSPRGDSATHFTQYYPQTTATQYSNTTLSTRFFSTGDSRVHQTGEPGRVCTENPSAQHIPKPTNVDVTDSAHTLNIINLTPHVLSPEEKQILQLGLGFCPSESIDIYETI